MSYTEFLRTKLAAQPKVTSVRKPTDASVYTQKTRMAASSTFFADGTSVGTLTKQTDRPVFNNASVSSRKASGRTPCASDFTSYVGSFPSAADIYLQSRAGSSRKSLPCCTNTRFLRGPTAGTPASYPTASSITSAKAACPAQRGDPLSSNVQFVDNTIRLSAMVPQLVDGCCQPEMLVANHRNKLSHQVDVNNQPYAVGKPFFMRNPPRSLGTNVTYNKRGGWVGPRPGYVENKHGYVEPTRPTPEAPGGQGQTIEHLKINRPTLFHIK
jgi:hypothetical protein